MRRTRGWRFGALAAAAVALLVGGVGPTRVVADPPPLWDGIGTSVDDVFGDGSVAFETSVTGLSTSAPTLVHRDGENTYEVTGTVQGIGWGGEWEDLGAPGDPVDAFVHYAYDVPFVLRWAPAWDGTLVYYSHGRSSLGLLAFVDSFLGDDNEGRRLEHEGDFVSDAVVSGRLHHAYFAPNVNGLRGDGTFSIVGLEPPFEGEPLKATIDVPLARDLVRVAQRLLKSLTGRAVERSIGTGHSAGALIAQYLDGGFTDSPNSGALMATGGDYVVPYDPSSGTLFQSFVPLAGSTWRVHPEFPMAVPMLMIGGLAEGSAVDSVRYAARLLNAGVDVATMFRTYQVRDLPHNWAEIVESTPNFNAFASDFFGITIHADGDRMQPVVAAVIEAAVAQLTRGIAPPLSRIDGAGLDTDATPGPDAIGFEQASGPPTTLVPSVFDPALDVYDGFQFSLSVAGGFPTTVTRYLQALAALPHKPALSLPKVTARLGGFRISEMLSDSELIPFDFASHWKSKGAYIAAVARAIDELRAERLYLTTR